MQWMQKYIIKILFITGGFLPLLATADLFNWFDPAEASVKKLCAHNAGVQLTQKVAVSGYFDERDGCPSCWLDLVELPVTWVEFCQKEQMKLNVISQAGCWRLSEISRTNQKSTCNKRLNIALKRSQNKAVQRFRGGHCIKVEYVKAPIAKIALGKESSVISYRDNDYQIEEQQVRLFNRSTQENLASSTTFEYRHGNNAQPKYCKSYVDDVQVLNRRELVMQYLNNNNQP